MQGLLFTGTKQAVRNNGRDVHIKRLPVIKAELACVANVSNRVTARKLDEPCEETLATQAKAEFDCASKVAAILDCSQSSIFP